MALRVEAGFDIEQVSGSSPGDFEIRITEATGSLTFDVNLTSGTHCHTDISSVMGTGEYDTFGTALKNALDTASTASGNGWTYAVSWNGTIPRYTILAAEGSIALTFTGVAGTLMRQTLGFTGNKSSASSHNSNTRPYYILVGAMGAKSKVTDDYEPDEIVEVAEADDGSVGSISRHTAPVYNDFVIPFESREATISRAATTAVPWTFQHFIDHVRAYEPFLVVDDVESTVHSMRARTARFKPERVTADFDDQWNWPFETYMLGRL